MTLIVTIVTMTCSRGGSSSRRSETRGVRSACEERGGGEELCGALVTGDAVTEAQGGPRGVRAAPKGAHRTGLTGRDAICATRVTVQNTLLLLPSCLLTIVLIMATASVSCVCPPHKANDQPRVFSLEPSFGAKPRLTGATHDGTPTAIPLVELDLQITNMYDNREVIIIKLYCSIMEN
ncbi:unnamed protein product [Lampetra fluviatilis]